jgi:hypothetical protein
LDNLHCFFFAELEEDSWLEKEEEKNSYTHNTKHTNTTQLLFKLWSSFTFHGDFHTTFCCWICTLFSWTLKRFMTEKKFKKAHTPNTKHKNTKNTTENKTRLNSWSSCVVAGVDLAKALEGYLPLLMGLTTGGRWWWSPIYLPSNFVSLSSFLSLFLSLI